MLFPTRKEVQDGLIEVEKELDAVVGKLRSVTSGYQYVMDQVVAGLPADQAVLGATHVGELYGRLLAATQVIREASAQVSYVSKVRLVEKKEGE